MIFFLIFNFFKSNLCYYLPYKINVPLKLQDLRNVSSQEKFGKLRNILLLLLLPKKYVINLKTLVFLFLLIAIHLSILNF